MRLAALLLVPLLAACAEPAVDPAADACGAGALAGLTGRDRSALAAMTFPDSTRFIGPDDAITMDFQPERLNIDIGGDGRVLRLWCG